MASVAKCTNKFLMHLKFGFVVELPTRIEKENKIKGKRKTKVRFKYQYNPEKCITHMCPVKFPFPIYLSCKSCLLFRPFMNYYCFRCTLYSIRYVRPLYFIYFIHVPCKIKYGICDRYACVPDIRRHV